MPTPLKWLLFLLATSLTLLSLTPGPSAQAVGAARGADDVTLPSRAHGQQAIRLLGDRLPDAAALNGMKPTGLRKVLTEDATAWLDEEARLYFVDPGAPVSAAEPAEAFAPASFPLEETFQLHSNPGSSLSLFLDFDGTNVSGTAWNASGLPNGDYPAWTIDGDATTFNDTERATIQDIWQRVAEDYAPFNLDVTTEDPGVAGLERSSAGDTVYGTRALVTPSDSAETALCGGVHRCGGVAYLNVFGEIGSSHQPAWVFPQELGPNRAKYIAEAVSHEVGHNFSLQHDGTTVGQPAGPCPGSTGYYCGHAMWAPIMGVGYYKPVVQWSKGEYANANNTGQDDLAIIAARAPLMADDASDTQAGAGLLPVGAALITSATDVDYYSLGTCSAGVTVTGTPAAMSPNLDLSLTMYDAAGEVVASADPPAAFVSDDSASGLDASISGSFPAGSYFLRVDGVGVGNPLDTGYSDYASLGSYTVTQTGCGAGVPGAPVVTGSTPSAGAISVAFTPGSDGGSPVTSFAAQCVSTNGGVNAVKNGPSSPLQVTGLTAGKSYHCRVRATNAVGNGAFSAYGATVTVPAGVPAAPTVTGSTPSAGAISVAFTPGSDGGSPVTNFAAQCVSTNGGVNAVKNGPSSPLQVTGLTAGKSYHCRVRATNAVGTGAFSAYGATVTVPAGVPAAPTVTGSTPSAGAISVAFTPGSDGGSPVTSFAAQCVSTNGGTNAVKNGPSSPLQVTGLTAGKSYHCRVRATNAVGNGAFSAYGSTVTVAATAPAAPTVTGSTPSAGAISVAFTPGSDGGSPVTSFTVQCVSTNGGVNKTASGAGSPISVAGLTSGKLYHCRVRATNAVGTGAFSAYGATVTVT